MSLLIRVKGASFYNNRTGFFPPVLDGALNWFHLGDTAAKSSMNQVAESSPGVITGGTYSTNYMDGAVVLQMPTLSTVLSSTKGATRILVSKPGKGNNLAGGIDFSAPAANASHSNPTLRSRLFSNTEYDLRTGIAYYTNIGDVRSTHEAAVTVSAASAWQNSNINFMCGTADVNNMAAAVVGIYARNAGFKDSATTTADLTGKTLDNRSASLERVTQPALGGNVTTNGRIYAALLYNRALTEDERNAVYDFLKGYYDRRGITGL